jgi:hypothetical protein
MAKKRSHSHLAPLQRIVAGPNTPEELEEATARLREFKKTALGQIGCDHIMDIPLPLLAQYVVELPPDEPQTFLDELVARLPADVLQHLLETGRARGESPAA